MKAPGEAVMDFRVEPLDGEWNDFSNGQELKKGLRRWVRGHSSLDDKTPDEVYQHDSPAMPGHARVWPPTQKAA